MRKKLSLSALEKKLDRIFSDLVRRKAADPYGKVQCVTCGKSMHWKESHAGHFIKRQHRSLRWNPLNCHPQCSGCNVFRGGQQDEYSAYVIKRYGIDIFNKLMQIKHTTVKFTRVDLEDMIESYREELGYLPDL